MESISYILDNVGKYKQMLTDRFMNPNQIDDIFNLHEQYTASLVKLQKTRKLKNIISNLINKPVAGDKIEWNFENDNQIDPPKLLELDITCYSKTSLIRLGKELKLFIDLYENQCNVYLKQRNDVVAKIPNLLHASVPIFENEKNNQIVRSFNAPSDDTLNDTKLYDQYELCCKLGIIEEAGNIAGHRGYFLVNEGVRLNYALVNYALDFLQQKGYKLMYTPHFMKKEKIEQVCQLSEFQETLYGVNDNELFLIATSEQPMTAYYADKQLNNLPEKLCGISTCYRKEAGKHGKDTLGIFRVHQFEKVEQFCVTSPEDSWNMMEQMIKTSQEFYESLGISYRVVNIVSKELNNAAALKYDLEGFFKGSGKYRELVSCSNTTDYFSRKIKTKCANKEFVHMLNSTLFANTRTICCLLETHQCADGVMVPEVLRKYYDTEKMMFK